MSIHLDNASVLLSDFIDRKKEKARLLFNEQKNIMAKNDDNMFCYSN
jgi:hypothetical protein